MMTKNILSQDEQPFKIPNHWQWTILDGIANWGSGGTPSKKHSEYYSGDIHWIKTGELNNDYIYDSEDKITLDGLKNSSAKLYPINTVIVAMYGATVGKVGILGIEAATNQACACAICNSNIHFKYLFYYLISQKDTFILISRGTAQPNISQSIIKNYSIPLPPLDEQKRIVEIIDSLFEKLDRAKAIAQNVVDGYELRRSKILHDAFTGQLTNSNIDDWQNVKWLSCIKKMQNGVSKRIGDEGKETIVLRLCDLKGFEINLSNARKISLTDSEQENYLLHKNDVLMIRVNGSKGNVGKQILITNSNEMAFCDHLIRIQFNENVLPKYMTYLSQHTTYKNYILKNVISTAGQYTISRKRMTDLDILIPTLEEQKEIVERLDSLLTKELQTKELAENVLNTIEKMKKKILGMAFRGLLTQNIQLG